MWAGLTGDRGRQRVTTGEFDNFSYCRHSGAVATPYCSRSSARHGEKDNSQLATVAMDGAMATRWQRQWTMQWQRNGNATATQWQQQCDGNDGDVNGRYDPSNNAMATAAT